VGSGSNLLIANTGVRGFVVKRDQQLTQITVDETRIDCGGRARLPDAVGMTADHVTRTVGETCAARRGAADGPVSVRAAWARP
jgi:UDP-N-acetylenolpyruvoylglucosamine reductase